MMSDVSTAKGPCHPFSTRALIISIPPHLRHQQVREDAAGLLLRDRLQTLPAVFGAERFEPGRFDHSHDASTHERRIFDDEDSRHDVGTPTAVVAGTPVGLERCYATVILRSSAAVPERSSDDTAAISSLGA